MRCGDEHWITVLIGSCREMKANEAGELRRDRTGSTRISARLLLTPGRGARNKCVPRELYLSAIWAARRWSDAKRRHFAEWQTGRQESAVRSCRLHPMRETLHRGLFLRCLRREPRLGLPCSLRLFFRGQIPPYLRSRCAGRNSLEKPANSSEGQAHTRSTPPDRSSLKSFTTALSNGNALNASILSLKHRAITALQS